MINNKSFIIRFSFLLLSAFMLSANSFAQPGVPDNNGVYKDLEATAFFKRTEGVVAMDGGFTIPLSDGRIIWLFGDTYVDHYDSATNRVPCLFQVRNSALLQPASHSWQWQQTQSLLSKGEGLKSFLKNKPDGTFFMWPGTGIQIGDTVFIWCLSLKNVPEGMGFDTAGYPLWAKLRLSDMEVVGFSEIKQDFNGIGFGQGFVKDDASGYIYNYGSKGGALLTNNIFVSRFLPADPYTSWQFWNGKAWTTDAKQADSIGNIPAFSTHVSKVKDKYLLLSAAFSLGCDQGKEIYASTSDSPTGPFFEKKLIYTLADTVQGHYPFFYLPIAHPEFLNNKDELLINYSINGYGNCVEACVNGRFDPEFYRPQAIRVPLKVINPNW